MRKFLYVIVFPLALSLGSCNQGKNSDSVVSADSLATSEQCYTSVFETDTAHLKTITDTSGKVTGELTISFGELRPNSMEKMVNIGEIAGSFKGDTLFVDYTYKSGTINKETFKNPLAFLKKGETLVLGVGDIETYMGRSYFVAGKPIDFEISKFKFEPISCQ